MRPAVPALVLALCAAAIPFAAWAGPWPRAPGRFFLATTSTLPAAGGWRPALAEQYAEYGLRPRLTLGLAVEGFTALSRLDLFARWHPADLRGGLAWGLTAGLRLTPGQATVRRAYLGLDLGRGFETRAGNLWLRAGAQVLAGSGLAGAGIDTDLSAQIGLRRGRFLGMLGASQYRNRFGRQTRLRPALGIAFGRLTLVAEAVIPPGRRIEALRLSVWSRF